MLSLGVVQLLLIAAAGVVATVLHRRHEGAVDALPEPDRGTLRVLLTGPRIAVLLLLVVVPVEIARVHWLSGSVSASVVPVAIGMAARSSAGWCGDARTASTSSVRTTVITTRFGERASSSEARWSASAGRQSCGAGSSSTS